MTNLTAIICIGTALISLLIVATSKNPNLTAKIILMESELMLIVLMLIEKSSIKILETNPTLKIIQSIVILLAIINIAGSLAIIIKYSIRCILTK